MAISANVGVLVVSVLIIRALLCGVYISAPDHWKLLRGPQRGYHIITWGLRYIPGSHMEPLRWRQSFADSASVAKVQNIAQLFTPYSVKQAPNTTYLNMCVCMCIYIYVYNFHLYTCTCICWAESFLNMGEAKF